MTKEYMADSQSGPPSSPPCSMHEVDPAYMGLDSRSHQAGDLSAVPAPPICASQWFNTTQAPSLDDYRGRVVVIEAFQMLCPGCVSHGLPQAQRIHDTFSREQVAVLGLHTVFEHHAAMTAVALEAFLHEYRVTFPVGVDKAHPSGMPETMRAYAMQGTPTLILIDALGRLRKQWFGAPGDLAVGAEIARLEMEAGREPPATTAVY